MSVMEACNSEALLVSHDQGQLSEGSDVVDHLMEQANVVPRINPFILSTDRTYLDFTASPSNQAPDQISCVINVVYLQS